MKVLALGLLFAALVLASGTCSLAPLSAQGQANTSPSWEYRVIPKEQLLDLGKKDLAAGLNAIGKDGWELVAIDGSYIFKRHKGGVDPNALTNLKNQISLGEYDVENLKDRVAWTERMVLKGLLTDYQLKAEKERLRRAELVLAQIRQGAGFTLPPPNVSDKKEPLPKK